MELTTLYTQAAFCANERRLFYSHPSSIYTEVNEDMGSPAAYIPMDRRQAMARGESLPDRTYGAALFADISGFTLLTEALMEESHDRTRTT